MYRLVKVFQIATFVLLSDDKRKSVRYASLTEPVSRPVRLSNHSYGHPERFLGNFREYCNCCHRV